MRTLQLAARLQERPLELAKRLLAGRRQGAAALAPQAGDGTNGPGKGELQRELTLLLSCTMLAHQVPLGLPCSQECGAGVLLPWARRASSAPMGRRPKATVGTSTAMLLPVLVSDAPVGMVTTQHCMYQSGVLVNQQIFVLPLVNAR